MGMPSSGEDDLRFPGPTIGEHTIIEKAGDGSSAQFGRGVTIGHFCRVAASARLGDGVSLGNYCEVGDRSSIGARTQVIYRSQVFADVAIGARCVIAGFVPNRVTIEDAVSFFGTIAHSYRDARIPWDSVEEPSPVIRHGSVVGMGAILIGDIEVGPRAYVAAGEVVRRDVPPDHLLIEGTLHRLRPTSHVHARE